VDVQDGPRYTHTELAAVAAELFDSSYRGIQAGVDVTRVSIRPQGTHVDVGVWPLPSQPPVDPVQAAARAQQIWGAQLPVVVTAEPVTPVTSRWDDRSPWKTGGQHRVPGGGTCSTGWALSGAQNAHFMLTAAHCAQARYGTNISNGAAARVIGTVEGLAYNIDAALIQVTAPRQVDTQMWDGEVHDVVAPIGVNDDVEFTKPVVDTAATVEGMWLCTSGASTGVHCNIKVIEADEEYENTLGWKVKKSAVAKQVDDKVAVGRGDSGGPVFSITGAAADVVAVGMNAGGRRDVACGGHPSPTCYKRVVFTRLSAVTGEWGLSVLVR
jgi:hypothetical protein